VDVPCRVVLDTNILLRGLLNIRSYAGQVVDACDRRAVVLLLNKSVLSEYRAVLTAPHITENYPELQAEKVEIVLRRLRYVGDIHPSGRVKFEYARDKKDEKFIELAIAGRATHIVTADKDLLSLASGHGEAARRFRQRAPQTRVLDALAFLTATKI
jgi:putative PIN family toxin of toxin-antitoxin system